MTTPLLLSLLALLVGPLLYSTARVRSALAAIDAFALVAVGGLVLFDVLPQSYAVAGWWVIPAALIGLLAVGWACTSHIGKGHGLGKIGIPLVVVAIALHALFDGVGLASGDFQAGGGSLPLAVVLHRIPVGLGVWWLARPLWGMRSAVAILLTIVVMTLVGFHSGEAVLPGASEHWIAIVQAVVAGSFLHAILRHPPALGFAADSRTWRWSSAIGALGGIALVLFAHGPGVGTEAGANETLDLFLRLSLESAPALLAAYAIVAIARALFLDPARILGGGSTLSQSLRGTLVGLPIPICSCGVIPLYRSLVVAGVPTPAAISFLVATPELGIAALALSWQLLGGEVTLARVGSAIILALVAGLIVGSRAPRLANAPSSTTDEAPPAGVPARLAEGFRYGFGDMVDTTAPWLLVGLGLAAVVGPFFDAGAISDLPPWMEVPLFALVGMPLYVCASGSTPLIAVLLGSGISPGAAIAFLLTGPATNITTFGVLKDLHGRRTALGFAALVIGASVGLGYGVNAGFDAYSLGEVIPGAQMHEHGASTFQTICLTGLGALFLVSLFRQGARGFVARIISAHEEDGNDCCEETGPSPPPAAESSCH